MALKKQRMKKSENLKFENEVDETTSFNPNQPNVNFNEPKMIEATSI